MNTPNELVSRGGGIGLFFANGIGDHIMTLPALRALVKALPPRIHLFAIPEMRHMLFSDLVVAEDVPIHLSTENGRNRFDPAVAKSLHGDWDLFVSLNPWHSSDMDRLLEHLSPALSIGMNEKFDLCVRSTQLEHSCDRAFRIVGAIDPNLRIGEFAQPPSLDSRSIRTARGILEQFAGPWKVMAVHNETLPHKVWSHRRLGEVLGEFLSAHEDVIAISLDREIKPHLHERFHPRFVVPGNLPLAVALALVAQADLFLGVDSCMLHMADICRVPGVGLFGPDQSTSLGSKEMGFRFGPHRHVHGHGSMDGIGSASVLEALSEILLTYEPDVIYRSSHIDVKPSGDSPDCTNGG